MQKTAQKTALDIPKIFRLPKPRPGIRRKYQHEGKKRVYDRNLKKRILAREIAVTRLKEGIANHPLQPQPTPTNDDGLPEEIKHANNLRAAYRMPHYQRDYLDPTPYITDHQEGEKWYLGKMERLDTYQERRRKWKNWMRASSLSQRVVYPNVNKLPNNQAPFTAFWNKQTVDWLSDHRWKWLHRQGMQRGHQSRFFKKYDRCHFYREYPAHNEVLEMMHETETQKALPQKMTKQQKRIFQQMNKEKESC